jgi:hypothetical protein
MKFITPVVCKLIYYFSRSPLFDLKPFLPIKKYIRTQFGEKCDLRGSFITDHAAWFWGVSILDFL